MINFALFIAFLVTLAITYNQSPEKDTKTLATKFAAIAIVFILIGLAVTIFFKAFWYFLLAYLCYIGYTYYKRKH